MKTNKKRMTREKTVHINDYESLRKTIERRRIKSFLRGFLLGIIVVALLFAGWARAITVGIVLIWLVVMILRSVFAGCWGKK